MLTLWDLIEPVARRLRSKPDADRPAPQAPARKKQPPAPVAPIPEAPKPSSPKRLELVPRAPVPVPVSPSRAGESMDERYERVTQEMLARFGVRVRKWRQSMSGMAWELLYSDGSRKRLIESPRPRGPMSMAIFLHEIGHHAIGFNRYKPRCLEEYHAWAWSIAAMREHELNVTDAVLHRMSESLWYAVAKARRRGLKELPPELEPYQVRPPKRRKQAGAK